MSRSPDEDKRRRLLQVSLEAFGEQGYRNTTIKQIADRAGLAPGSVYTYFHDKDALFLAAISEIWDRLSQAADSAADNQQISYRRRALALFEVAEDLVRRCHTLLNGIFADPERRDLLRRNLERACVRLLPFLEEGRRLGLTFLVPQPERQLYQLRIVLSGILWDLALREGEQLEQGIAEVRTAWAFELARVDG